MEFLSIILASISEIGFVLAIINLGDKKYFRWQLDYKRELFLTYNGLSMLTSLGALILNYQKYQTIDMLLPIIFLISTCSFLFSIATYQKNKQKLVSLTIKKGTYELGSLANPYFPQKERLLMQVKQKEKEFKINFNCFLPLNNNEDLLIKAYKGDEKNYQNCAYLSLEKKKIKDFLKILINFYILVLFVLSGLLIIRDTLIYTRDLDPNKIYFKALFAIIGYFIFNFGYLTSRHGQDLFTKFWHYISLIFSCLCLFGLIFLWLL